MKRALVACTVLAALAFSALGMGTFSGKWEAGLKLLPSPLLTKNVLTVNYTDFGMTFSGILSLLGGTSDTFTAKVNGAFGPFTVSGQMDFDFDAAAYLKSKLSTSLDFAGLGIGLLVENWGAGNVADFCQTNTGGNMKYTLTAKVDPISAKIIFVDCCTGTVFYSLTATLSGIGLCCGISLDAEFSFLKTGFNYLSLSGIEIPLCCGVSITAGVTFTTTGKEVTTGFEFAGFGDACFTVYADAVTDGNTWSGIEVYGWKIKCSLGDCSYLEVLTALDVDVVDEIEVIVGDIFQGDEFEYVKLGLCGAGCCGGQYTVGLAVYFDNGGGLFGISRLGANMSIPVMSNFTVNVSFSTPDSLSVGWTFTF